MIYRMRMYRTNPEELERSHEVFYREVLPVHLDHGARFVGRWATEDDRLVVLWEYDSKESCLKIQEAVATDRRSSDPSSKRAQQGLLEVERDEWLMHPTGPQTFSVS